MKKQRVREELTEFRLRLEIKSRNTFLRTPHAPAKITRLKKKQHRQYNQKI